MNRKEQLQAMLTPANWEELSFYVQAAAHNEDGPDIAITDQSWEDAINEIVNENRAAQKIMREDYQKYQALDRECATLRAALREKQEEFGALSDLYMELIMEVGNKYPNETRHETALRYLRNAENHVSGPSCHPDHQNPTTGQGEGKEA